MLFTISNLFATEPASLLEVHLTAFDCRQDSDFPDTRKRLKGLVSVDFLIQQYTLIGESSENVGISTSNRSPLSLSIW